MNIYSFAVLCFAFCSFLLGLLVWLKRQDNIGNQYFLVGITQAGWAIFLAVYISLNANYNFALLSGRLSHLFALFIPTTWYRFILSYIGEEKRKRFLKTIEIGCVLFTPVIFSPWFIPKMISIAGFKYYVVTGPIYHLFPILFFFLVLKSFLKLIKKIKKTSPSEKPVYKGLFWAALAGYLGGSLTFLPAYGIPLPQYGVFLLPIYPFGISYFLMRHGLFDVEELAQAAHRDKLTAIGVLAASINHEVRSPLFVIKGLAETWLEKKKSGIYENDRQCLEKGEESFAKSIEQADRAMDIIKRLSSFAKAGIESEIKFEQVNLREVLDDIVPLVRYELKAHNIILIQEIPPDLPELHVDRRYLEEILFNLIVNAIQALKETGKPGEIKITAGLGTSSSSFSSPESRVTIAIQDNGPGIPEDKLKDVFRPFYTTKAEGTGLGLYIVKQLVEKNGGKIEVHSQQGIGTIFNIFFKDKESS